MWSMLSMMSRRWDWVSLKGKDGLTKGAGADWLSHPIGGREIDFGSEEIGEAALDASNRDQSDAPGEVEVCEQIDVGVSGCFAARDRSEETQMDETGGLQLRGVGAQDRQDAFSIHE